MLRRLPPFHLTSPSRILSGRDRGGALLEELTERLRASQPDAVTPLDFAKIDFVDISCADEFLTKLLMRIGSGELGARYVTLRGANLSVRETLEAVLTLRGLAALHSEGDRTEVLGTLKAPIREALDVILAKKSGTSSEIARELGKNINIACNRLNVLQRMGLVCRAREGSAPGGGRQYTYESIA
jgi:hypothetical protein